MCSQHVSDCILPVAIKLKALIKCGANEGRSQCFANPRAAEVVKHPIDATHHSHHRCHAPSLKAAESSCRSKCTYAPGCADAQPAQGPTCKTQTKAWCLTLFPAFPSPLFPLAALFCGHARMTLMLCFLLLELLCVCVGGDT